MNTFREHVKNRTKTRQLAINNDNCSINPEYEIPLTIEIYEQLEDLKTVAIDKGREIAKDFYNRYFDTDSRAIEMCFIVHDEKNDKSLEYVFECLNFNEEIKDLLEALYNAIYKRVTVFNVKVLHSLCNPTNTHNWAFSGILISIENASCSIFDVVNYDVISGFQQTSRGTDFSGEFFQIPHVRYILNAFLFEALTVPIIKYWYQCEKDYRLCVSTGNDNEAKRLLKHDAYIDDIKEWLDDYHNGEFTLTKKVENRIVNSECAKLFVELNNTKVKYCIFYNRNKGIATLTYKNRNRHQQLTFSALDEADKKEVIEILYARLITDTIVFNFGVYNKQYPLYGIDWKWFLTTVDISSDIIDLSDSNFMFEIEQNNRLLIQILEDYKVN